MTDLKFIDTHCHLEKFTHDGELEALLERAQAAGVLKMIAVGTSIKDWSLYQTLSQKYPNQIYYTVGLHPCYVEEDWRDQAQVITPFFADDTLPVALGEIGLDYYHLPKDPQEAQKSIQFQKAAFKHQLEIAYQLECPIVIHSREAFEDCVQMIDASGVDWTKVVFHCFPGGPEEVRILNQKGGRASFTGIVTYKNAQEVRDSVAAQGLDLLMVETDAPYLAPTPYRGQKNEPAYVKEVAQGCADALGITLNTLSKKAWDTSVDFFNL